MKKFNDFSAVSLQGQDIPMADYQGKVVLVVNTASNCGFTKQYEGLQALYEEFKEQGLEILGFPCNQFGEQEKGSANEISEFCQLNYGVSFQMFDKVNVNGDEAHPIFRWLKREKPGILGSKKIKWNFTKFLLNKDGDVVARFGSTTKPEKLKLHIQKLL